MRIPMSLQMVPLVATLSVARCAGANPDVYVSPGGDDANPGTREAPFKTLEAARDAVRARPAGQGATVNLLGGRYPRVSTFELGARDSGSAEAPVVYRAAPGEKVRIDGGVVVPGEACRPVTDETTRARLLPKARDQVRVIDLHALGITNFGTVGPRGFARSIRPAPLELFVDGKPMEVARWPNKGEKPIPLGKVVDQGSVPRHGDFSYRGGVFKYEVERAERWADASDWYVSGIFNYGYADDIIPVAELDLEAGTIRTALPHLYGFEKRGFTTWFALNLLEEIDRPGEYAVDTRAGRLYFYPPEGSEDGLIQVSLIEDPMVSLEGTTHVHLKDLVFENARGSGVYIEGGAANRVEGCTLRNLGVLAVQMGQGASRLPDGKYDGHAYDGSWKPQSRIYGSYGNYIYQYTAWDRKAGTDHAVVDCLIHDTGAGGVLLGGGDRKTLTPAGNLVENCDISRVNRWERMYKTPVNIDGVGNIIRNCHLHDCPGQAILMHGNDHIIELNEMDRVVTEMSDQAAIYSGRDPSEAGTMIRHNFFHHLSSNHPGGHGVQGIFFDDYGTYTAHVVGNVFYKAGSTGVIKFFRGGESPIVNNIVVDCPRLLQDQSCDHDAFLKFMHEDELGSKRVRKAVDIMKPPYSDKYPVLVKLYKNERKLSHPMERNYVVNGDLSQFVDPESLNFQLKDDSSVYTDIPGFERIPFERIGLQEGRRVGAVE